MIIKRTFDILASALGLLLLWPILLLIWILLKFESKKMPAFFTQKRVGRNGELFTIYKFRTMSDVTNQTTTVTTANDTRITPIGRHLRAFKLDELPELWNVLKGDMSFVGPRPDVEGYADNLSGDERRILQLRPGITGPASMKYRDEERLLALLNDPKRYNDSIMYPDKVRLNMYYLNHYSFIKDLKMIICTVLGLNMKYADQYI